MNKELSSFAARLRGLIAAQHSGILAASKQSEDGRTPQFSELALELFALQFKNNAVYRKICEARRLTPKVVGHWTQIPAVPTGAFKELELSCIPPEERTAVFHSSGTTEQKPSRHFHCAESLAVHEASLWPWFDQNIFASSEFGIRNSELLILAPPLAHVPHSSLVHMFETVRKKLAAPGSVFVGKKEADGAWTLNFKAILAALSSHASRPAPRASKNSLSGPREREGEGQGEVGPSVLCVAPHTNSDFCFGSAPRSPLLLGTAFSFVHLIDILAENNLKFQLPESSRVMETGGYKNRSRSMPKAELHSLITERLGVPSENIICEYGMSELSSQAYDSEIHHPSSTIHPRIFRFPPWSRVQIISPETGREVAEGETGLIRVFDLANFFSVMAVQTEDLGVRRGDGFELIGRAQLAEPRGCSLMTVESRKS